MTAPDAIHALVEKFEQHEKSTRTLQEKEMLQRQIEATYGQVDKLVNKLYELTKDEVKIVVGKEIQ
jgi:hypothetical protein